MVKVEEGVTAVGYRRRRRAREVAAVEEEEGEEAVCVEDGGK